MRHYKVNTICNNCGNKAKYEIEYARRIGDVYCVNCGCYNLSYLEQDQKNLINSKDVGNVKK